MSIIYSPGVELAVDAVAVVIMRMLSIKSENYHIVQPCILTVTEDWGQMSTCVGYSLQLLLSYS